MSNQNKSKKISPITWILIGQLAIMAILIIFVTKAVGTVSRKNALDNMQTITDERAQIIQNFVVDSEKTLNEFCKAEQVTNLLSLDDDTLRALVDQESPSYGTASAEDKAILAAAQKYTEEFGAEVDGLEGFWIGTWDTLVMTHTNAQVVGMTTRKDPEKLQQLRDAMVAAGDGVYNTGIIISPATSKQILSLYKAVYDEKGNPIGLVGFGIFSQGLVETLNNLEIRGIDDSSYYMLNTADNKYIFIDDPELVSTETANQKIIGLDADLQSGVAQPYGSLEYTNDEGVKTISMYSYMPDYNWVLLLNAPKSEVYAITIQLRMFVLIFGLLILGLVVIFGIINAHQEAVNRKLGKQIAKNEATKESLSTAMFKDILTEVQNRVSLSMDLDKVRADAEHPCYFVMFNISEFSNINTQFGNDAGDAVLVNTAQILTQAFTDGTVYRTGSDEFVVAIQKNENTTAAYNQVYRQINEAHGELLKPQEIPGGAINVGYKIALVRKSSDLSTAVITVLKDMTNHGGRTNFGQVQFVDMDTL